nr:MAG: hypothetical protein 1 [Salisharnavirus sp.]
MNTPVMVNWADSSCSSCNKTEKTEDVVLPIHNTTLQQLDESIEQQMQQEDILERHYPIHLAHVASQIGPVEFGDNFLLADDWVRVKRKCPVHNPHKTHTLKRQVASIKPPPLESMNDALLEVVKDDFVPGGKRYNRKEVRNRLRNIRKAALDKPLPEPHGLIDDYPNDPCVVSESNDAVVASLGSKKKRKKNNRRLAPSVSSSVPIVSPLPPPSNTEGVGSSAYSSEKEHLVDSADTKTEFVADDNLNSLLKSISGFKIPELDADSDLWVSHLENIVIMAYQLSVAKSFTEIFVAVVAYIKMNTKKSVLQTIMNLIDDVGSSEVEPHAWTASSVVDTWNLFANHPMFEKISYLISAAMSISVCSIREIEWNPLGLKLIRIEAAKEQLKAYDVIDAAIKTFVWFAQTGYRVFQTGSISPFLYGDPEMKDFHDDCDYVLAHADTALAGNLDGELEDYEYKVDKLLGKISAMKSASSSGALSIWLQKKYGDIVGIKQRLYSKHKSTAIRFQPFGMSLTGSSGVGKSTLAPIVMKTSLSAMGFPCTADRIATYDKDDAYDSTYTSDIVGLYIDDMGNGKSDFVKKSPSDVIIKMFNNVAAMAVKAEINQKGVTFIDFKVGVVTSNLTDLGVREYSNKPESILRRLYHTRVEVKDEFRKPGSVSLDPDNEKLQKDDLCQDIWKLKIEECHIYESGTREAYAFRTLRVTIDGESILCENMNLSQYLDVVVHLAKKHARNQRNLMVRSKNFEQIEICDGCSRPSPLCKCKIEPHCGEKELPELAVPTTIVYTKQDGSSTIEFLDHVVDVDSAGNFIWTPRSQDSIRHDVVSIFEQWSSEPEPQAFEKIGEIVLDSGKKALKGYIDSWFRPVSMLNTLLGYKPVSSVTTNTLAREFQHALDDTCTPWLVAITPDFVFRSSMFRRLVSSWQSTAAYYDVRNHLKWWSIASGLIIGGSLWKREPIGVVSSVTISWIGSLSLWQLYKHRINMYEEAYCARRDALPEYVKSLRDSNVTKGFMVAATFAVGLKFVCLWNEMRMVSRGEALPQGVINQDASATWYGTMLNKLGVKVSTAFQTKTATSDQLLQTFRKNNLFWASIERGEKTMNCNAFFPQKGVCMLPRHVFFPECNLNSEPTRLIKVSIDRDGSGLNKPGSVFHFLADYDQCVHSKFHDLVLIWVPNCPDFRSRVCFLPLTKPEGRSMCDFLVREREGFCQEKTVVHHGVHTHSSSLPFYGGIYRSKHAVRGSCMGLLIKDGKDPCILGMHIAGKTQEQIGYMQTVVRSEYDQMLAELRRMPGVVLHAEPTQIPSEQYHLPVLTSDLPHPNCLASKFDKRHRVEVVGSTRLRTQMRSSVNKSILSEAVVKHTGVPNIWGPPRMQPNWRAFNATLEHIANPSDMIDPSLLRRARDDYLKGLVVDNQEKLQPLSNREAIIGVQGVRFLDALQMSTSMGFPVFGKKRSHFSEVIENGVLLDRIPDEGVRDEMDRLMTHWLKGERAYPVFTSTLKDEPTDVSKDKVRVFQAGPVALTIWVRKFFLPLVRWLALHPIESESAVGVNCMSRDWEKLIEHATKFAGDKQMLAWDYSKYDVRMSAQMTMTVYSVLIDLAKKLGYAHSDLVIMENMITDLVHPLLDYNGVMLMAFSINVSGISLTVQVNSIAGSLYVRCGYFATYPDDENFRDFCAALTYGDDFIGSVHSERRKFNFRSFKNFLSTCGMVITPPSKTGDDFEFMRFEDVDFLKRKSNFIPEIGIALGALDEMSIFKSLHSNLASKSETPREVASSCIETAMHEWFAHGRQIYEKRQTQMARICEEVKLPIPAVSTSFDDRVAHWRSVNLGG